MRKNWEDKAWEDYMPTLFIKKPPTAIGGSDHRQTGLKNINITQFFIFKQIFCEF